MTAAPPTRTVAVLGMWQETNTYSPRPTTLADFEAFELLVGEPLLTHHRGKGSVIGGFLDGLAACGAAAAPGGAAPLGGAASPGATAGGAVTVAGARTVPVTPVGVFSAGAWPAAPPDAATTAELLARLDRALAGAPDVDGVLVNLHGAMVCDGAQDMEAETLERIRARFGAAVPVAAVLDLHANPSARAVALCDAVVGYRTYPHVDMHACGEEAAALLARAIDGERIVTVLGKLPALTSPVAQGTDDEPMRGLLARAEERARAAGVLRISLLPGFPYSDVERCGFSVTAVVALPEVAPPAADPLAPARAVVAETLADVAAQLRDFATERDDPATAVARARALAAEGTRPVVLADLADNVGGGAPGDGTALLAELIAQGVRGAVVLLVDPAAVAVAHAAAAAAGSKPAGAAAPAPGATIEVALGGHSDALHGTPVEVTARVVRLGDGRYTSGGSYMTGQEFSMGATAVLDVAGVIVVAMSRATPPFHLEQLGVNGIDPGAAPAIAVKGAVAWRAPYAAVTAASIEVDTPGCCPADPHRLPRTTAPVAVDPMTFQTKMTGAST
ncbi:M81 family metallopeptidase [Conexibacter woesei]|uniref:Microcystin LR degradation protein MlrC-like protein n=1 Tax=Conexibacter woesei (strain DSM 14684 / CCUG 47730 / CIP 108061 / JCM 11494 / NBRC 100937 / ID131577) TaxID=469383 RepID=D3FEL3_CONWI|nr:M81 family metallopeptidase [Conexibacter woesei]ADB49687.1 Microcystin LR degradation protein MlrC-like protein [Conexibacter woesei DSM 14684]